ncbi:MAG TPA: glutamine--fructose-6-phosphate transaminase (isomerizing) [Methanomassiliicoccales archaeon]|jgi:glucosamine--fructose-6-phosphate aminotransferase (isomerizing)|nr:glutamine--fructose-6-phosphate transaminase (isomerizing) [Methanomassiliicoccales archaeon]
MCGIMGYSGHRRASEVLVEGLKRLEYRGYDSAGVAMVENGRLAMVKRQGELDVLQGALPRLEGRTGIGHTRWATCGRPSDRNAHPFLSCDGKLAIVHNGIIENHSTLRKRLEAEGHHFTSETDTEVVVHLLEGHFRGDLRQAMADTLKEIKGTYAIAAVLEGSEEIVAARKENPLVIGLGVQENFLASDVTALLSYTNKVLYVMDGETVSLTPNGVAIFDSEGAQVKREPSLVSWSAEDAQKGGFEHFMLKEIFEGPNAIHNTLLGALDLIENGEVLPRTDFQSVKLVACGSSYHAAMVGKYAMEEFAGVPTTLELASEYRYSPGARETPLVILITQSGETADTLAAAREARRRGCHTLAVTNVVGSTITREVDEVLYTRAGPEIGVAATKTFLTQLVAMYLVAIRIGYGNGTLSHDSMRSALSSLRQSSNMVQSVLNRTHSIEEASRMLDRAGHCFFIGRNINYPTMLEGALKLKEISYIHAEGFAAGELKHGPLALLDATTPVIAVAIKGDHTYEKMLANISEVAARDSPVLGIGVEGDTDLGRLCERMIAIQPVEPVFSPLPVTVALQALAYYVARRRGCSIDKPKNLAKSVTVE